MNARNWPVALLLVHCLVSASEVTTLTTQIGRSSIVLTSPAGYTDLCASDQDAAKLFPSFVPADNALLACYTTPDDLKEWKNKEGGTFRSYLISTVMKSTINRDITPRDLSTFKAQVAASLDSLYQQLEPAIRQQIDTAAATVSDAVGKDVKTTVNSLTPIGMFDDGPLSFSTVWIANVSHDVDGARTANTQVQISSSVLVKGRLLVLFTYGQYTSASDIEKYKSVARKWVAAMLSENT